MVIVILDRLLQSTQLDLDSGIEWNANSPISLNDIREAIEKGIEESTEGFGDNWKYLVKEDRDNEYHISRIVYFINHPKEISEIEVDNQTLANRYHCSILPNAQIIDGHHRLMAAAYLGMKKIKINYGGRMDVLNYLKGKRKFEPRDII